MTWDEASEPGDRTQLSSLAWDGGSPEIEAILGKFEAAWQAGPPPTLGPFLHLQALPEGGDPSRRRELLEELIKIDLEFRWRKPAAHLGCEPLLLEDYLSRYPALGPASAISVALIAEEYRVRQHWSDRPTIASYLERFPAQAFVLPGALAAVDADLAAESAVLSLSDSGADTPLSDPPTMRIVCPQCGAPLAPTDRDSENRWVCPQCGCKVARPAAPSAPFPAFEDYEILDVLGRGGMGVVYRARQRSLGRLVALKMIRTGDQASPRERARFRMEAEAAARLQHPHIVQIYEVGEQSGSPYLALEFIDGVSLAQVLGGRPQPPRESARLIESLARAIHYAHQRGIVHRDLKPANILLAPGSPVDGGSRSSTARLERSELGPSGSGGKPATADSPLAGSPKITDFGLAKQLDSAFDSERPEPAGIQTQTGAILGTPNYMAPEQAAGRSRAIGPATDVYALGTILYEMVTGRPPFQGASVLETLEQVRTQEPVPPRRLQGRLARDLETICLKCLEKEPAHRYATAEALAEDLRRYLAGEPILARPASFWERSAKWARRRPALAALITVSVAAIVVLLAGGLSYHVRLRAALTRAERQQARATLNFDQALDAVDRMLLRGSSERLADIPETAEVRQKLLEDALEFFQQLLEDKENPDETVRLQMARTHERRGLVLRFLNRVSESEAAFGEGIALVEALQAAHPADPTYPSVLAGLHLNRGQLYAEALRRSDAEAEFHEAIRLWQPLSPERPEVDAQLALCYQSMANSLLEIGRSTEAEEWQKQALALRQTIVRRLPERAEAQHALAQSYYNQATLYVNTGRQRLAEPACREAIAIWEPMVRGQPQNWDVKDSLAHAYTALAQCLSETSKDHEHYYQEAVRLAEEIAAQHRRQPARQATLAYYLHHLGSYYQTVKRPRDAVAQYERAAAILERLNRDYPANGGFIRQRTETLQNLGLAYFQLGQREPARKTLEQARDLIEPRARAHPAEVHENLLLAAIFLNLGLEAQARGAYSAMLDDYTRALEVAQVQYQRDPRLEAIRSTMTSAHGGRAMALIGLQRYADAADAWRQVLAVCRPEEREEYQLYVAITETNAGHYRQALAAVAALKAPERFPPLRQYNLAAIFAAASGAVFKDESLSTAERARQAEQYAERALGYLAQARSAGYFNDLKNYLTLIFDSDLNAIRARPDFKKFCSEVMPQSKPAKPTS